MAVLAMSWQTSYAVLGAVFCCLAALYCAPGFQTAAPVSPNSPAGGGISKLPLSSIALGFFVYMTAEMILITWLPAYLERDRQWGSLASKSAYGVFLAGMIAGRMMCAGRWPEELTSSSCAVLAAAHAAALAPFLFFPDPAA